MKDISPAIESLGKFIQARRLSLSMSLEQLADATGFSRENLSRIEAEEFPEFSNVMLIASALRISLEEMLDQYLKVESNPETLFRLLAEITSVALPSSWIAKIVTKFLEETEPGKLEDSIERLYFFTIGLKDDTQKLHLYAIISKFANLHGIRSFWAKSLFQSYLIERNNFEKLSETYEIGKGILPHACFLHIDEQITFYYKLGAHAHHLRKFNDCIIFGEQLIQLDQTESVTKAYMIEYIAICYFYLGKFDLAEMNMELLEKFKFSFIKEKVEYMTAKLNVKKGNIDLAVVQLKQCIKNYTYKVSIMNELMEIYLERQDLNAIEELFLWESYFVDRDQINIPVLVAEYATYYGKKSEYFKLIQDHEQSFNCLSKSIKMYISVDRYRDATENIGILLGNICTYPHIHKNNEIMDRIQSLSAYLNNNLIRGALCEKTLVS